jgi:electron transfer flavoprotein beta subunit
MNIFVCVSHVPDTTAKIQIGAGGTSIDQAGVAYILNPYDEYGLEAGLQLKEARGGEVTALCLGPEAVKETIRKALAMGADKGIHIKTDAMRDSYGTALALADVLRDRQPDVVFCGRQSIDYDGWQMASLLGEMLQIPSVSVAYTLEIDEAGNVKIDRDIEGGKEMVRTKLPAVLSAQKGLNNPRYPKLQGIMAAKKKPIEEIIPAAYENRVEVLRMTKPPLKQAGRFVGTSAEDVPELVRLLHEESKVL